MSKEYNVYAKKGSERQMQIITLKENQKYLNVLLNDELEWKVPNKENGFKECQLNQHILETLGIDKDFLKGFWASRGPQWDGIAIGKSGTLYLFEGKAHRNEPFKRNTEGDANNNKIIHNSISEAAKRYLKEDIRSNESLSKIWFVKYYQIANRITFTQKLNTIKSDRFNKVKMIFLCFVNDETWMNNNNEMMKSDTEWYEKFDKIFVEMGVSRKLLEDDNIFIKTFNLTNLK